MEEDNKRNTSKEKKKENKKYPYKKGGKYRTIEIQKHSYKRQNMQLFLI